MTYRLWISAGRTYRLLRGNFSDVETAQREADKQNKQIAELDYMAYVFVQEHHDN